MISRFGALIFAYSLLLVSFAGCGKPTNEPTAASPSSGSKSAVRTFQVKGVVKAIRPTERQIEIKHDAIPGYMSAMTMPFDVRDTNELKDLQLEQPIAFRLTVTETDGWVDMIQKLGPPPTNAPASKADTQPIRVVEPLKIGDLLPEYHLTNELNESITTTQYKGQALAITFLFTRCPFPTFCPRLANDFAETQQRLLALQNGPTNWHLLTISFDPEFDQPAVLKAYAMAHHYDPAHSTFASGALSDISALGDRFGLVFWRDASGSITHNMRTAVINAKGQLQRVFEGNDWTSAEMVAEMVKAANP